MVKLKEKYRNENNVVIIVIDSWSTEYQATSRCELRIDPSGALWLPRASLEAGAAKSTSEPLILSRTHDNPFFCRNLAQSLLCFVCNSCANIDRPLTCDNRKGPSLLFADFNNANEAMTRWSDGAIWRLTAHNIVRSHRVIVHSIASSSPSPPSPPSHGAIIRSHCVIVPIASLFDRTAPLLNSIHTTAMTFLGHILETQFDVNYRRDLDFY